MVISVQVRKGVSGIYRRALDLALKRLRRIVSAELDYPKEHRGGVVEENIAMSVHYDVELAPAELSVIIQIIAPQIPRRVTDAEDIITVIAQEFSKEIPGDMVVHYLLILTKGAFISAQAES